MVILALYLGSLAVAGVITSLFYPWQTTLPAVAIAGVVMGGLWKLTPRSAGERCTACGGRWPLDDWVVTLAGLGLMCPSCGHRRGNKVRRHGRNKPCSCADCLLVRQGMRVLRPTRKEHLASGNLHPAVYHRCKACGEASVVEDWTAKAVAECPRCGHGWSAELTRMTPGGPCQCPGCLKRRLTDAGMLHSTARERHDRMLPWPKVREWPTPQGIHERSNW